MKNKIKKLKLPLSKMTGEEKDYTAVLLEDVNSNMKAFWEVLSGTQNDVKELKEKGDATWELLQSVKEKGDATFEQVGLITESVDSMNIKFDDLIKEISSIKVEMKSLKTSISAKEDKEKFETLEMRIIRIEKHLELSTVDIS